MAHQAIYRKWRPVTFDDIIGQEHITRTLKNQILSGTVGHAYLFCGTRGTGKTTCAKVLSRAVNCLNPQNGNPCNECEVCRGILDGSIMDVTEMDAASNNSVDDIRSIKEDINYVASNSKYTVYIIDEVHMLSTSAFNALLKTLEEPPENVIFILATTEAHKLPQTILSRCQRFDFKRIRNEDIIVRMKEIAHSDGYEITEDAYRMLASLAEGSMRDGLSIMERVISSSGNSITAKDIEDALGISGTDTAFEMTDAIINGDTPRVISVLDRVINEGKELSQFSSMLLNHFRTLMICKLTDTPETVIDCDAGSLVKYKGQSERISFEKINHASTLISNAISDARVSKSSRIVYELAFIKLTRPDIDVTPEGILDRLSVIESRLVSGVSHMPENFISQSDNSELLKRLEAVENAIKNGNTVIPQEETPKEDKTETKVSARLYSPIPEEELNFDYPTAVIARNWEKTLDLMIKKMSAFATPLKKCSITFDADGIIALVPEDKYNFTQRTTISHIDELRALFKSVTGTQYTLKVVKRSEFDPKYIINPFHLKKTEDEAEVREAESINVQSVSEPDNDMLDNFMKKFSNIITDGDRQPLTKEDVKIGEQSVIDDEDDEKEEFLEESELAHDDEEGI